MKVTEIEEVSKSRSRIYIDDEFAFVLYKGELRKYDICKGEDLPETVYTEIMEEILPKRARLRAMNLLTKKDYTRRKLEGKLREGGYPENIIEDAIGYVESYRYVDDLRYAVTYITDHESSRSRRRMEQDLMNKGIDRCTIENAFREWEALGGTQNEDAMIRELLQKRHYHPETATPEDTRRMYAYLMRKGFTSESVRRIVLQ